MHYNGYQMSNNDSHNSFCLLGNRHTIQLLLNTIVTVCHELYISERLL